MQKTSDFDYELPQDRIAITPPAQRSGSKLLVNKEGRISDHRFTDLPSLLPPSTLLMFNDSRVIPARIMFRNSTGALIEVFLLEPEQGAIGEALTAHSPVQWKCMVGNKKRWKPDAILTSGSDPGEVHARWLDRDRDLVTLEWSTGEPLASVLSTLGKVPLPPYLNRDSTPDDAVRYQTVYARFDGAVAAPTAGLHFTEDVLESLKMKDFSIGFLTLHVGAGTFLPVKVETITDHSMHEEELVLRRSTLEQLATHTGPVIPVGTTSMRSLETIYWLGAGLLLGRNNIAGMDQEYPYLISGDLPTKTAALDSLIGWLDRHELDCWTCRTSIFIRPGYRFMMCDGLITNFHQPRSTLLMLISALIGDNWRRVYDHALNNNYRFLSFGDSSLLIP
ncbi:MAG: S-adenosylmethionine:tRNA ribosyltransferase-isomerase [Bacteroidota bacterium]